MSAPLDRQEGQPEEQEQGGVERSVIFHIPEEQLRAAGAGDEEKEEDPLGRLAHERPDAEGEEEDRRDAEEEIDVLDGILLGGEEIRMERKILPASPHEPPRERLVRE